MVIVIPGVGLVVMQNQALLIPDAGIVAGGAVAAVIAAARRMRD